MLSPGVYITETDKSQVVTASSNSTGVFAGDFSKGPVGAHSLINTIDEFVQYYGKPNATNYNDWFQVYTYLTYASQIYVSRASNYKGNFVELANTKVKQVGQEVPRIPGVQASNEFATAVNEGVAGNNLKVTISQGAPIITQAQQAASNDLATAVTPGEDGNNLSIKITKTGHEVTKEAIKATSDIATAVTPGEDGNKIKVEIKPGADFVTVQEQKASCDLAVAKLAGSTGNDLRINVTGAQGAWVIDVYYKDQKVQTLNSIADESDATNLDSSYLTFVDKVPFEVKEYQLTGGVDEAKEKTFDIITTVDNTEEDNQNVQKIADIQDNAFVTFHIDVLATQVAQLTGGANEETRDLFSVETLYNTEVKDTQTNVNNITELSNNNFVTFNQKYKDEFQEGEFPLANGLDEESEETFIFRTIDKTAPYDVLEQRNVQQFSDLKDNAFVIFNRAYVGPLQLGEYPLEGGVDGSGGGFDYSKVQVSSLKNIEIGNIVKFESSSELFKIIDVDTNELFVSLDRKLDENLLPEVDSQVYDVQIALTGVAEAVDSTAVTPTNYLDENGVNQLHQVPKVVSADKLFGALTTENIINSSDFEEKHDSISFTSPDSRIKFFARNPGTWAKNIKISIAHANNFELNDTSEKHIPCYAFPGILVDDLYEYAPKDDQLAVSVYDVEQGAVVETYLVSLDETARDSSNKSMFIENVINGDSTYIFCKVNEASTDNVADYTLRFTYDALGNSSYIGQNLVLTNYRDSDIQRDDLIDAYDIFGNKEEIDIDCVIANEFDDGSSAKSLTETRQDCICFIGARYSDVVNKKSLVAINNLVNARKSGYLNFNSMFTCAAGNYIQIYDKYNDKNRYAC